MTSTADRASTERFPPWLVILVLASAGFLALAVELSPPAGLLTRMAPPDLNVSVATAGSLTALYALGNAS